MGLHYWGRYRIGGDVAVGSVHEMSRSTLERRCMWVIRGIRRRDYRWCIMTQGNVVHAIVQFGDAIQAVNAGLLRKVRCEQRRRWRKGKCLLMIEILGMCHQASRHVLMRRIWMNILTRDMVCPWSRGSIWHLLPRRHQVFCQVRYWRCRLVLVVQRGEHGGGT